MEKPIVTFIIPSYNYARYIEQCVHSIQKQTIKDIEIIVVNDGSTDNSKDIIDALARQDNRIVAIHKENAGVSAARNSAIDVAKGEYLVFVDADDFIAPEYAEYMLDIVKKTGAEFVLSTDWFTRAGELQTTNDEIVALNPEDATTLLLSPRVIVGSWNKMYKKSLFDDNNIRFNPNLFYGEGLRVITQIAQLAKCTGVGHRKVYYYRRSNDASACTKFNLGKMKNGLVSIDTIENDLTVRTPKVLKMIEYHRCQFYMGIVVRMQSAGMVKDNKAYYKVCLAHVRKHLWACLPQRGISLYKKSLLVGTAICPSIMARLDIWRRNRIKTNSVEEIDYRNSAGYMVFLGGE